jgi:hypothetical protein
MKKLQNLRIMDDDRIDMEDIEHQGEYEYLTTIENNPNKNKRIKDQENVDGRLWQFMNF